MKAEIKKEIANAITHGLGLLAFLSLIPLLFVKASMYQLDTKWIGLILFAVGLVAVYASSTIYHAIMHEKAKRILRIADHISIYFLIAGSYSAFMLMYIPKQVSYPFLYILWSLVVLGTVKKLFLTGRYDGVSTMLYIFLGCMGLFLSKYIFDFMPVHVIWLIFIGGACYLLGVVFYIWKKFNYHHAVWHVFVFAGSMCHFFGIYFGFPKLSN